MTSIYIYIYILYYYMLLLPSVLWRCWLGGRKGIRPVKTEWWGTGVVIYLERGADLHMAQLMPLPLTVSCFSKIQIGFTFLVLAHLGSPEKGLLNVSVCIYYRRMLGWENPFISWTSLRTFDRLAAMVFILRTMICPEVLWVTWHSAANSINTTSVSASTPTG